MRKEEVPIRDKTQRRCSKFLSNLQHPPTGWAPTNGEAKPTSRGFQLINNTTMHLRGVEFDAVPEMFRYSPDMKEKELLWKFSQMCRFNADDACKKRHELAVGFQKKVSELMVNPWTWNPQRHQWTRTVTYKQTLPNESKMFSMFLTDAFSATNDYERAHMSEQWTFEKIKIRDGAKNANACWKVTVAASVIPAIVTINMELLFTPSVHPATTGDCSAPSTQLEAYLLIKRRKGYGPDDGFFNATVGNKTQERCRKECFAAFDGYYENVLRDLKVCAPDPSDGSESSQNTTSERASPENENTVEENKGNAPDLPKVEEKTNVSAFPKISTKAADEKKITKAERQARFAAIWAMKKKQSP